MGARCKAFNPAVENPGKGLVFPAQDAVCRWGCVLGRQPAFFLSVPPLGTCRRTRAHIGRGGERHLSRVLSQVQSALLAALLLLVLGGATQASEFSALGRVAPPPVFDIDSLVPPQGKEKAPLAPPADVGTHSTAVTHEGTVPGGLMAVQQQLLAEVTRQLGTGFSIQPCGSFLVASDLPPDVLGAKVCATLALCQEALKRDFFARRPPAPVVIYAFRDRDSYRYNLRRLWNERPISPYGHYSYTRRHVVFNCATGLGTMIHESVHALMDADMPQAPIWIAEGVASLYEQCVVEKGTIRGTVNWRLPELQAKVDKPRVSLAALLRLDDEAFKEAESLNYATARFFCMYMEEQGLLRRLYRRYRDRFRQDPTGRRFVEAVFEKPLAQIERDWKAWVRALPPYKVVRIARH